MSGLVPQQSAEAQRQQAEVAHKIETRIKQTARAMRTHWIRMAEDLFRFQQMEMWRHLGHDSFDAWLADPEVALERRWTYQLIATWRELVVRRNVDPVKLERVEPSKVQEVLPAIRRGYIDIEEGLADAESLSRTDLRQRYGPQGIGTQASPNGAKPDTSTRYDAGAEPQYVRCPTCNSRVMESELR